MENEVIRNKRTLEFSELENETERAKVKEEILKTVQKVDISLIHGGKASFVMMYVSEEKDIDETKEELSFNAVVIGNTKHISIGFKELYEKYPMIHKAVQRQMMKAEAERNPIMRAFMEALNEVGQKESQNTEQKETPENG